ncbi:MAG: hypothetical protein ACJ766_11070 [Thermoleophilaceae bacterium]
MRRLTKLGIGGGLALVGVVALAAGVISLAFHHNSQAAAKRSASRAQGAPPWARAGGGPPGAGRFHFRRPSTKQIRDRREQFHSELAKELGVSTDKIDKAFRDLFEKHLNQAVDNGNLTSKQRDQILKCYDDPGSCTPPSGGPPMGGPRGFGPPGGGPGGPGGPGFGPPM